MVRFEEAKLDEKYAIFLSRAIITISKIHFLQMPHQLIAALSMLLMKEPALEILAWEHLILEINNVKLWEDTCQFLVQALSLHSWQINM